MTAEPTPIELLELDIDVRLADLWGEADDFGPLTLEGLAAFIRVAYARGYADALTEPTAGTMLREHGYKVPVRRAAT